MAKRGRAGKDDEGDLRITAGAHRGARLRTPPGHVLRPMRSQVRQALFNILGPGAVEGARALDLFAGSGSLSLEALSRGAARAVCVDVNPVCLGVLRENAESLRLEDRVDPVRHDLARGLGPLASRGPFDLVFIHPPFALLRQKPAEHEPDLSRLLGELAGGELLAPGARVCFETPRACYADPRELAGLGLEALRRREYGSTALFVCCRPGEGSPEPEAGPSGVDDEPGGPRPEETRDHG